ncbi:MAG TPA: bifunctional demethylmenaquinone methyltransferase/2-methoxy-6-polyprenyl-1,4-benzoquinol methylase UbiE [Candidatus Limnocylindrales bacterium]|nr:bifunctional demethylmenaquinone methyltransferase/2-methoxy-6-polyprenyl-1,4-benzoquinol methylase UbiE [Candidatus Limnocylindrales bacterium]
MNGSDHDKKIAAMFDRVAARYDRLNRILSLGNDIRWRRRAVTHARLGPNEIALDVGVGTGDLAFDLLAASDASSRVVGVDLSDAMLDLVRARAAKSALGRRFEARPADAQALPFADASFDRVVAGFAVRNFGDLDAGLREMHRVLRASGRAVILEFSQPPNAIVRALYRAYLHQFTPRLAVLFGGDAAAYGYLPRSIDAFPGADVLAKRLAAAGFRDVSYERLLLGSVAIHVAHRRGPPILPTA